MPDNNAILCSADRDSGLVSVKRGPLIVSLDAHVSALACRVLPHRVRLFQSRYLGNYRYTPSCPRAGATFETPVRKRKTERQREDTINNARSGVTPASSREKGLPPSYMPVKFIPPFLVK